jgi:hypothetical protein
MAWLFIKLLSWFAYLKSLKWMGNSIEKWKLKIINARKFSTFPCRRQPGWYKINCLIIQLDLNGERKQFILSDDWFKKIKKSLKRKKRKGFSSVHVCLSENIYINILFKSLS